jgi:FtsP/CotA-like multicopper oxidase with cupredoxin domain
MPKNVGTPGLLPQAGGPGIDCKWRGGPCFLLSTSDRCLGCTSARDSGRERTRRRTFPVAVAFVLAALGSGCNARPRSALLREFEGSYPVEARPNGTVRAFEITAAEAELPLLDGGRLKVWAYNGQVPGPTLRVRLGDTVRVQFHNRLPQPSTIHWHGVRVPNGMDGVPHLTQPPVEPGGSFSYEFVPKDAGTFWFHPHVRSSEQVERGLYGVLVVEDVAPAPYAQDVVWVLDDWLLDDDRQILAQFNTPHDLMHDGRWGNVITVNGRTDTRLAVRTGDRIRLRLVNSANGRIFKPDFGSLDVQVIAVDGLYLRRPVPYSGFELAPGNRLDLDITFSGASSGLISVRDRFFEARPNPLAEIVVDGIAGAAPRFSSPAHAHVPAWRSALAEPVAQQFRLNARRGGQLGIEWTINERAFEGHDHAAPPALTMRQGVFQHLQFTNQSYRLHPIHLHGMFFRLLARNGVAVDEPFFRDTVLVHAQETIDIGLVPEDPGRWMMHCHILEHAEAGMMTTLAVTSALEAERRP